MTKDKKRAGQAPPDRAGSLDARFRQAMDSAPVMIWVSGTDKLCVWFNKPWLRFTGRTMEQELGNGWAEDLHPDDLEKCLAVHESCFDARKPFQIQYRLMHHDGSYRWIDDTGAPRYAEDGAFLGYIGSCTDIHDSLAVAEELSALKHDLERQVADRTRELKAEVRLRQEAELAAAELAAAERAARDALVQNAQQFQLLIEGVVDYAIYLLDPKGIVTSWNRGAKRIKGYAPHEIIGRHVSTFYTAEDRAAGAPEKALATAELTGRYEEEGWRVRKDGSRLWASVIIDAIRNPQGELIGFAKITRDMTDRRKAETELAQAREQLFQIQKLEALGQLTGGVAHDFNNLLTIIAGNLELAQRALESGGEKAADKMRRLLAHALTGAKRAATLTQRLLAFARRQPLDPKPLNVNRFIAGIGEFLQRTLGEQIAVESVGGGGLWAVEVDVVQLESALLNIALNSRDAMPAGGKLTIETSNTFLDQDYARKNPEVVPGQYVLISVTDTGAGMSPEVTAHAFEPFFTTKLAGQGTGLGLSQVYGFVKQSNGHVKVYSEVGEGTTVKVYLPRLVGGEAAIEPAAPEIVGANDGETILIVEDDEGVLEYVVEVLQTLGYRVLRANGGVGALKYIGNAALGIDLLLTDVVMPGMNGRSLSEEARRLRPKIKVLFMTGYSQNAIVHQGRLDPGVQLIQKPLSQGQLATKVRDVLDA